LALWALPVFDGYILPYNQEIGISLEPGFGYISGVIREIVYPDFESVNPYLSELVWECKNVFFSGGSASINFINRLFLNGGIWFPINKGTGEMNDSDWLYTNLQDWTHWSNHNIFLDGSFLYDINASFAFLHINSFFFSAILGFAQNYYYWTDKPNNYIYTSISEIGEYIKEVSPLKDIKGNFTEDSGISYKALYSVPYLGLGIKFVNSYFILNALCNYTFIGWAEDHDHHIVRSLHFLDTFKNCSVITTGINLKTNFFKHYYFSLTAVYEYFFETKGDVYMYDDALTFYDETADIAGFQSSFLFAIISLGVSF